jgi:prepilin peptidase CpaA
MGVADLLLYVPLLAALVWAAAEDVLSRRIRNVLTFALAGAGFAQSFLPMHTVTPWDSAEGFAAGFGLMLMLYAVGALGGGDVKLLAAVGTWVGPMGALNVFLAAAVVGMIIVLTQSAWNGKLIALFRNSYVLVINLVHVNELGVDHVAETGATSGGVDKPLPYAVPILIATVAVLMGVGLGEGLL